MANLSEDIQCVGSDTRPPMLDRTDFASWQQCIRLYCQGNKYPTSRVTKRHPHSINHYTDAKDIWDNVKMLLEGSELTKEDRESQLYDDFEHFCQNKGETIHDYYVRFTKLINDMRNIKMTMPRMQLNSKFVNNMLPEWVFLTYLQTPPSTHVPPVTYQSHFADNTQLDSLTSPIDNLNGIPTNTLALLTQSYKILSLKLNNQLRYSSTQGTAIQFKMAGLLFRMFRVDRTEVKGTIQGVQVQLVIEGYRTELGTQILVKLDRLTDECDAFDSDVDEAPTTQNMFMANLSSADPVYDEAGPSYDSDILSEVHEYDNYQDAVCEHHDAHEMYHDVQPNCVVDSNAYYTSDSNMIPYD
ncbi:hypothetical protein Tco_1333318 [Tanacetum coccineum]